MKTYSFEKLDCWQNARQLAIWAYEATKSFPANERFGLVSQMCKAAISVASNIAEGTSRKTAKDQAQFITIAYSSTIELLNDLIITHELSFLSTEQYEQGRAIIEKQTLLISGLRNSQQKSKYLNPKP